MSAPGRLAASPFQPHLLGTIQKLVPIPMIATFKLLLNQSCSCVRQIDGKGPGGFYVRSITNTSVIFHSTFTSMPPCNIIVFGPIGCGKSSIVNMLLGEHDKKAHVSGGAKSGTEDIGKYCAIIEQKEYNLFDTIGLDRGNSDQENKEKENKLTDLIRGLLGGVSLLVYCMRGPSHPQTREQNYVFMYNELCRKNVRIAIVVTGLEDLQDMDSNSWWNNSNEDVLTEYSSHRRAYITATRGRWGDGKYSKQAEYNASKAPLRDLIVNECLQVTRPWRMPYNIIFSGPTGCGKSSVINMLLEEHDEKAPVSIGAEAGTKKIEEYFAVIGGKEYNLVDTVGLGQGNSDQKNKEEEENLTDLIHNLLGGVSLLVYCMRGPSRPQTPEKNYVFVHDKLCGKNVRTAIVVTGLEDDEGMDPKSWWNKYRDYLQERSNYRRAYITATVGKEVNGTYSKQAEYDASKAPLRDLIVEEVTMSWEEPPSFTQNIVFFGATGCGKSSVINMLLREQDEKAAVSDGAKPCTMKTESYLTQRRGIRYQFFDTVALDQAVVQNRKDALVELGHLMRDMQEGVSLLVYCVRGPRLPTLDINYEIFYEGFCRKEVPIFIVVTGLEDLDDTESWWSNNKAALKDVPLAGHACITATVGKKKDGEYSKQEEYNQSKEKLWKLLSNECNKVTEPWKMGGTLAYWYEAVFRWIRRRLPFWVTDNINPQLKDLYEVLVKFLTEGEAEDIVNRVDQ
ncbi:hypothetical protein D9757_010947 [Collybiopsis confluens]|uniref:G domain-containing protein n=1 Tax=Collybiopsis confluens TaxID=2823264 RepID=A0A8H5GJP2_9AGAR|nr:hypothetical protein D9757_010947 [Collybiopsis confluens]